MTRAVEVNKGTMYNLCRDAINTELNRLLDSLKVEIGKKIDATITQFFNNLSMIWDSKCTLSLDKKNTVSDPDGVQPLLTKGSRAHAWKTILHHPSLPFIIFIDQ